MPGVRGGLSAAPFGAAWIVEAMVCQSTARALRATRRLRCPWQIGALLRNSEGTACIACASSEATARASLTMDMFLVNYLTDMSDMVQLHAVCRVYTSAAIFATYTTHPNNRATRTTMNDIFIQKFRAKLSSNFCPATVSRESKLY
jgi:hypothetical protein